MSLGLLSLQNSLSALNVTLSLSGVMRYIARMVMVVEQGLSRVN